MKRTLMIALGASLIGAAYAVPVSMQYNAGANLTTGSFNTPNAATAGLLGFNFDPSGYGGTNYTQSRVGYCLTPTQYVNSPWDADQLTNQMDTSLGITAAQAGQIGYLAGLLGGGGTAAQHAVVQIAIWNVLGATVTGVNAPDVALATAGSALAAATVGQSAGYTWYRSVRAADGAFKSQDMVEAVPEPFTMALGVAGLAAAVARKRRPNK